MGDNKKFYWLKLKDDFFKRHDIRIIEAMDNGKDYVLFYLKLLVESISHEGRLRFSDAIPYSEKMLATITDTNIDIVRVALKVFQEFKLVEILDDETLYMSEVTRMIGSESASTERVRQHREQKRALQCNTDVTTCNAESVTPKLQCNIEKERELDTEKEPELDKESRENSLSPSLSREELVDKYGEANVKKYETKFIAWQKKEKGRGALDMLSWIARWMSEDNVKPPKKASFNTDSLKERVMSSYKGGEND